MPKPSIDRVISVCQLASILGGVVYIGVELGKKDAQMQNGLDQIKEMSAIVQDLMKVQVALTERTSMQDRTMQEVKDRLDRLEHPR